MLADLFLDRAEGGGWRFWTRGGGGGGGGSSLPLTNWDPTGFHAIGNGFFSLVV